ncbi:hypothetical protein ABZ793_30685 [Micromonospora sp. NPDC047465]|uniref:hypothetical protein n=1 Tax=Micromonospora sp. NPDC047465 TaxID=3154813 RepID=UPI0033E95F97
MKILAGRDGITLPKTYVMVRQLFLWEQHRAALPTYYRSLLGRIFDSPYSAGSSTARTRSAPARSSTFR